MESELNSSNLINVYIYWYGIEIYYAIIDLITSYDIIRFLKSEVDSYWISFMEGVRRQNLTHI